MEKFPYIIDDKFSPDYVFNNFIILAPNVKRWRKVESSAGTFNVKANSDRYILFKEKGLKCVYCDFVATYAKLMVVTKEKAHFNFYGLNNDGEEEILTKDHIIPRSFSTNNNNLRSFIDTQKNYQPLCKKCNTAKKDDVNFDLHSDPNGVIPDGFKHYDYVVESYLIPRKQNKLKFPLERMSVKINKNGSYDLVSYTRVLYDYFNSISRDEFMSLDESIKKNSASNFNNILNSIDGCFFI